MFKVYDYDIKQTSEIKKYMKETVESSEKVLKSGMKVLLESDMKRGMKVMKSELLSEIRELENGMRVMKSELLSEIRAMGRWW